jgi:hypothetical protein
MDNKQIQTLDEDISYTLEKLHVLLQYSTRLCADEVSAYVEKAMNIWSHEMSQDTDIID